MRAGEREPRGSSAFEGGQRGDLPSNPRGLSAGRWVLKRRAILIFAVGVWGPLFGRLKG